MVLIFEVRIIFEFVFIFGLFSFLVISKIHECAAARLKNVSVVLRSEAPVLLVIMSQRSER